MCLSKFQKSNGPPLLPSPVWEIFIQTPNFYGSKRTAITCIPRAIDGNFHFTCSFFGICWWACWNPTSLVISETRIVFSLIDLTADGRGKKCYFCTLFQLNSIHVMRSGIFVWIFDAYYHDNMIPWASWEWKWFITVAITPELALMESDDHCQNYKFK